MAYYDKRDEVKDLRDKIKLDPEGAYLFWGEEEYLKHYYLGELRKLIDDAMAEFNTSVIDFRHDGSLNDIEEAVDSLPIMAERKIVEVWGMDILSLNAEESKRLIKAVKRVDSGVILVIFARDSELDLSTKKNKEKKIIKDLRENLTMVEFERQSEQKLLSWVDKIFRTSEVRISDVNITRMIKLCDYSMTRLKNDSEKLIAYCKNNSLDSVPNEIIDLLVKPCAENEVWDFTDAIARRSRRDAMEILENLRQQNVEPIVIVSMVVKTLNALAYISTARGKVSDLELLKPADLKGDWQVKRYRQNLDAWTDGDLRRAIELAVKCEIEIKSIKAPDYVLVEVLTVSILGNKK